MPDTPDLVRSKQAVAGVFHRAIKPAYVRARRAVTSALERRAGIHTEGLMLPHELGFDATHRTRYQPAGWYQLRRILKPSDVEAGDVFIDFGSGMGRIVYQAAAWYPFKRVIGVELSEELHKIACSNLQRTRHRLRCVDVELVNADALEYSIPDDLTVIYLNNPFTGPVFEATVAGLVASLERRPRHMRVIYSNPYEEAALLGAGFHQVRALRGWRPTPDWSRSNSVRMYARGPGLPPSRRG